MTTIGSLRISGVRSYLSTSTATVELHPRLTVVIGETASGKSSTVHAMQMILSRRCESNNKRAQFSLTDCVGGRDYTASVGADLLRDEEIRSVSREWNVRHRSQNKSDSVTIKTRDEAPDGWLPVNEHHLDYVHACDGAEALWMFDEPKKVESVLNHLLDFTQLDRVSASYTKARTMCKEKLAKARAKSEQLRADVIRAEALELEVSRCGLAEQRAQRNVQDLQTQLQHIKTRVAELEKHSEEHRLASFVVRRRRHLQRERELNDRATCIGAGNLKRLTRKGIQKEIQKVQKKVQKHDSARRRLGGAGDRSIVKALSQQHLDQEIITPADCTNKLKLSREKLELQKKELDDKKKGVEDANNRVRKLEKRIDEFRVLMEKYENAQGALEDLERQLREHEGEHGKDDEEIKASLANARRDYVLASIVHGSLDVLGANACNTCPLCQRQFASPEEEQAYLQVVKKIRSESEAKMDVKKWEKIHQTRVELRANIKSEQDRVDEKLEILRTLPPMLSNPARPRNMAEAEAKLADHRKKVDEIKRELSEEQRSLEKRNSEVQREESKWYELNIRVRAREEALRESERRNEWVPIAAAIDRLKRLKDLCADVESWEQGVSQLEADIANANITNATMEKIDALAGDGSIGPSSDTSNAQLLAELQAERETLREKTTQCAEAQKKAVRCQHEHQSSEEELHRVFDMHSVDDLATLKEVLFASAAREDTLKKMMDDLTTASVELERYKTGKFNDAVEGINVKMDQMWESVTQRRDAHTIRFHTKEARRNNAGARLSGASLEIKHDESRRWVGMRFAASHGQKALASVIFRIAVMRESGSPLRTLVLDNPSGFLDVHHTERLAGELIKLLNGVEDVLQLVVLTSDLKFSSRLNKLRRENGAENGAQMSIRRIGKSPSNGLLSEVQV